MGAFLLSSFRWASTDLLKKGAENNCFLGLHRWFLNYMQTLVVLKQLWVLVELDSWV